MLGRKRISKFLIYSHLVKNGSVTWDEGKKSMMWHQVAGIPGFFGDIVKNDPNLCCPNRDIQQNNADDAGEDFTI